MPHLSLFLCLSADHEAGSVAQRDDRQTMSVAQLDEPRHLVGGIPIDRSAEMARVVGKNSDRTTVNAAKSRHDADTKMLAHLDF